MGIDTLVLAVLGAGFVVAALALRRANELFAVAVREGRAEAVRGRLPQALLVDIGDIVARPPVRAATIRAVSEDRRPKLVATGDLRPEQLQQLRNVLGRWTLSQLRTAPRVRPVTTRGRP